MTINIASKMLTDASTAIAERQAKYGPPNKNFKNIALLWQDYLRGKYGELATLTITEADVAVMSALIKIARLAETPDHVDSWVDLAGYAACGRQVTAEEETTVTVGTSPAGTYEISDIIDHEPLKYWKNGTSTYEPDIKFGDTDQMQTTGPLEPEYTFNGNWQSDVDAFSLSHAIGGDFYYLAGAFVWRHSPQGGDYWNERQSGREPISNEDRLYLMWLRDAVMKRNADAVAKSA